MVNMLGKDHCVICADTLRNLIRPASASWSSHRSSTIPSLGTLVLTIIVALVLSHLIPWILTKYKKMQDERKPSFPFLNLPRELRDMCYMHLIEDPFYPPPPASQQPTSSLSRLIPSRWISTTSNDSNTPKPSTWILLACKQTHEEYTSLQCKRATFHLSVTPQNYQPPSPHPPSTNIWNISPAVLSRIRSCTLQLVTTSAMLGVCDPRNMASSDWPLAQQIRHDLAPLTRLTRFTLDAKAIGDPLWNPLWIWYHACQSLKNMGAVPGSGPRLDTITFSLDTWSPGENYMARDRANKGCWTWYCMEGHEVGVDGAGDVSVREFCGKLYASCRVCRPELESDGEE